MNRLISRTEHAHTTDGERMVKAELLEVLTGVFPHLPSLALNGRERRDAQIKDEL